MTENEAWKRYKKRKEARLKARGLRKDADGEWITIKGTHVKIGDDGEITGRVADKIKATSKRYRDRITEAGAPTSDDDFKREGYHKNAEGRWEKNKFKTSDSVKPKNTDYDFDPRDTFQEFIHKNVEKARPIYEEKGMYGVQEEYYKTRLQESTKDFKQIDDDDIDAVLDKYIDKGKARLWLQEYDHNVKPVLAMQLTANPEVRNAAMNIMYKNYASYCKYAEHKEPLSFEDFLVTPIKMYRGGSGKEYKNPDVFSSYTFSKDVASKFRNSEVGSSVETDKGRVYEAEIRPIDTFGSLNTSGEMEIFVPGFIAPNGKYDSADFNTDASDDEGRWITTENGHKVHLNEEGEPDNGNKHVIEKMEGKESAKTIKHNIKSADDAKKHRENIRTLKDAVKKAEGDSERISEEFSKKEEETKKKIAELEEQINYFKEYTEEMSYEEAKKGADRVKAEIEKVKKEIEDHIEKYGHYTDEMPPEVWEERHKFTVKEVDLEDEFDFVYDKVVSAYETIDWSKEEIEKNKKELESFRAKKDEADKILQDAKGSHDNAVAEYNAYFEERNKKTLERIKYISDIRTDDDATDYLRAKGYFRGEPIDIDEHVDLSGMYGICAYHVVDNLDRFIKDYPFLKGELDGISCLSDKEGFYYKDGETYAYAERRSRTVVFSEGYFSDPFKIAESYDLSARSGFSSCTDYSSIVDHEYTHIIEHMLNEKLGGRKASDIVAERVAMRRFELSTPEDAWDYPEYFDFLRESVSGYSVDNKGTETDENGNLVYKSYGMNTEFLAEAVSGARCTENPNNTVKWAKEEFDKLVKEVFG